MKSWIIVVNPFSKLVPKCLKFCVQDFMCLKAPINFSKLNRHLFFKECGKRVFFFCLGGGGGEGGVGEMLKLGLLRKRNCCH